MAAGLLHKLRKGDSVDIQGPCTVFFERLKGKVFVRIVGTKATWRKTEMQQNRGRPFPVDGEELGPEVLE